MTNWRLFEVLRECERIAERLGTPRKTAGWMLDYPQIIEARHEQSRGRIKARQQRRRARVRAAPGRFSEDEWQELCVQYDHRCAYCGEAKPLTVDHWRPLSRGGSNAIENIRPACKSCNSRKGSL